MTKIEKLVIGIIATIVGAQFSSPLWATNEKDATRVVSDAGLTPTKVGGYAWFQCGKDDTFATKFAAVNKDGKTVEGAVCKGLFFKGSTIRYK